MNSFTYPGVKILCSNEDYQKIKKINFCGYEINNSGLFPFLTYLLVKCHHTNSLVFPTFDSSRLTGCLDELIKKNYALADDVTRMEYMGYLFREETMYVFYDLGKCNIRVLNGLARNNLWFGLMDEIINQKHICNIKISTSVTDFFSKQAELVFLKDDRNMSYEIPSVAYVGREASLLSFTLVFGVVRDEKKILLSHGPHFYFTNYRNAIKQGGFKKTKGGLVRFALFLRDLRTENDDLEQGYDSLCVYDTNDNPTYAVRDYEQQFPLSYHIIDNKYLGLQYDNMKEYFIL